MNEDSQRKVVSRVAAIMAATDRPDARTRLSESFFSSVETTLPDELVRWRSRLSKELMGRKRQDGIATFDFYHDIALDQQAYKEGLVSQPPPLDYFEVPQHDIQEALAGLVLYPRILVPRTDSWRSDSPNPLVKAGVIQFFDQMPLWKHIPTIPQLAASFAWLRHAVSLYLASFRASWEQMGLIWLDADTWIAYQLILEASRTGQESTIDEVIDSVVPRLSMAGQFALAQTLTYRRSPHREIEELVAKAQDARFSQALMLLSLHFGSVIMASAYFNMPVISNVGASFAKSHQPEVVGTGYEVQAYLIATELTYYVPSPRTIDEACNWRSHRSVTAFRDTVREWADSLAQGRQATIERIKRDVALASRDFRALRRYRRASRILTYLGLPVGVAGALMGLPIGLVVAPFGLALRLKQDALERATAWTMLGR